jgi:hypothetical protein
MMFIDMTTQLIPLMAALDAVLVFAAAAIAVSAWNHQRASFTSRAARERRASAVVGFSNSVPASAGDTPSDTSVSEAA